MVEELSQYAKEREVLFPPLTMLKGAITASACLNSSLCEYPEYCQYLTAPATIALPQPNPTRSCFAVEARHGDQAKAASLKPELAPWQALQRAQSSFPYLPMSVPLRRDGHHCVHCGSVSQLGPTLQVEEVLEPSPKGEKAIKVVEVIAHFV